MKKACAILFSLLLFFFYSKGQSIKCKQTEDTFFYITLDIRSNIAYSINMSGVSKSFTLNELSKDSVKSLISSFYLNSYFVPEIVSGYKKMLLECLGDSLGGEYLKKHLLVSSQITSQLQKQSIKKKIILKSGETVFLHITKIKGKFWEVLKDNPGLSFSSDELDITEIKEIKKCYVPFEIYSYFRKCKI